MKHPLTNSFRTVFFEKQEVISCFLIFIKYTNLFTGHPDEW